MKHSGLGRGLDALISTDEKIETEGSTSINEIELSKIIPNPNQPRTDFDEQSINELSVSIKTLGLIQPITLRELSDNNYQIIAGERRYRAAKKAGLDKIPAYIKSITDNEVVEFALIENIQREDLNAIEIALSFQKLLEIHKLTQDQLSDRIGKNRATIANYLRLLKLPAEIQLGLKNKKITMGHARALLATNDPKLQLEIYEATIKNGYSVRTIEKLIKNLKKEKTKKSLFKTPSEYEELQGVLSDKLNTKVKLKLTKKGSGNISIPFKSEEQLIELMKIFDNLNK